MMFTQQRLALLASLMVSLLLATPGANGEVPNGVRVLTQLADGGDADAQYGLGTWYLENHDTVSDLEQARDWLLQAARQQHVHAMFRLGVVLSQFDDVRDETQALDWTRSAAEAGLADAQASLGMYLFQGMAGTGADCDSAVKWLEKADAVDHPLARSNLVWVLATCPDPRGRDGSRALRMAFDQVYRRGLKSANQMDNLAAAYAAAGDFLSAEVAVDEAIAMETDEAVLAIFKRHRDSYLARKVWLEIPDRPNRP